MRTCRVAGSIVVAAIVLVTGAADAQVTRLEIDRRELFADGRSFGNVGPYEKLTGRIHLEVDPDDPANQRVTDLQLAPRNADGMVEVTTDFFLLKPVDPARGNRRILYDVNNRGNKVALGTFNDADGNDPTTLDDAGNGFLLRQGYAVLWCGWSSDVEAGNTRLTIEVPVARNPDGTAITGKIYNEIEISVGQLYRRAALRDDVSTSKVVHSQPLVWGDHKVYPPVSLDNRHATLTKRERRSDPPIEIARDRWAFARWEDGRAIPDSTQVYLEESFQSGWLYDLVYEGKDPRVVGLGFVAVRDVVSFFRYQLTDAGGAINPLARSVDHALAYGGSQSGRFLHHLVWEGFNADPEGRQVFDGLFIHLGGSGKGIFNYRFAQNTRHGSHHHELLYPSDFFPFTSVPQEDPVTGRRGSMLDRARALGVVPKIFFMQSATEYWSRAGSLIHTDVAGTRDVDPDPNVRIYLHNGVPHASITGGFLQNPINPLSSRLSPALLVALDRWATLGIEPPPSRYPKIADGTLVNIERFRELFPSIPGAGIPHTYYQPFRVDPGPRWYTEGIADHVPPKVGRPFQTLVPAVDQDGNELGGIRLPHVAVPLATYTGWNIRADAWGAAGMLTRWTGSYLPFPKTPEERRRTGDPRLSVLERYPTRDVYLTRVVEAALKLEREGYLLAEDVVSIVRQAAERNLWASAR